jgi:hypothetical protein
MEKMKNAIKRACEKSKETGKPHCVVQMEDENGDMRIVICSKDYTMTDEFEAYFGEVLWE